MTFGLVVAKHPDNDRTTGCPGGWPNCPQEKKMVCYYDNMNVCYGLGVLATIASLLIGLSVVIFIMLISHLCRDKESEDNGIFVRIFTPELLSVNVADKEPLLN
jgi:hypothetical protein